VEREVARADALGEETLSALDRIADKAAGIQREFKKFPEVADKAGCILVAAEARVGEELAAEPKATGTRGTIRGRLKGQGRSESGGTVLVPPD